MPGTPASSAPTHPKPRPPDHRLHVVVATAEPRGAYHLAPLHAALRSRPDLRLAHLVPYPEPVQGLAWDEMAFDAQVLASADRVVVTGGSLSAWTDLVWRRAAALGVEVRYSELAFLPASKTVYSPPVWPQMLWASALCSGSEPLVAQMFPGASVVVTGVPLLSADTPSAGLPSADVPVAAASAVASSGVVAAPASRRVLLLSRTSREQHDPQDELGRLAGLLRESGFLPVVRCHPREDRDSWEGFMVDDSEDVFAAARGAFAVCGYPGTLLSLLAAAGHPAVALETSSEFAAMMPAHQRLVVPAHVETAAEALAVLAERPVASASARLAVSGPPGPSADRVVSFWCD